ncbi:MAG: hypothetical protein ABI977_30485 [Acidobacteriota bacterium]
MPKYDNQFFSPPAPVASVTFRNPLSLATLSDVLMLIDPGADVTIVPQSVVDSLGASVNYDEGVELDGFGGQPAISPATRLDLIFQRKTFKGRFPVAINQDGQNIGIIGRDVLNHIVLVLDGPRLDWNVQ